MQPGYVVPLAGTGDGVQLAGSGTHPPEREARQLWAFMAGP
jgi:hypothetical protein